MAQYETIEGIRMAVIADGTFQMGHDWNPDSPLPEAVNPYYPDEQPVHNVAINPFLLGITTITQAQYEDLLGENPSHIRGADHPVTNMGAGGAERFMNALSERAGLTPCYDPDTRAFNPNADGFRFPTEAEWEYACRAGTDTMFHTGNSEADLDRAGWYLGNSGGETHPVAQKEPNAAGLYDMHGNVHEFCEDNWIPAMCYERYLTAEEQAGKVFSYYHDLRVVRGGSWFDPPAVCRSFTRSCYCNWDWISQGYYVGFRVAMSRK